MHEDQSGSSLSFEKHLCGLTEPWPLFRVWGDHCVLSVTETMLPLGVLALVVSGDPSAAAGLSAAAEHHWHAWPRVEGSSLRGSRHVAPRFSDFNPV